MKNYVKLMVPIFTLALLYSCSKDRLDRVEENGQLTRKSAMTDYLDDFYDVEYALGDAIETTDETGRTFEVSPVTLSGDTDARGYLAMDEAFGELVYFVDVDRVNYVMTTKNIEQDVTAQYDDIDGHEQWEGTEGFDFMIIINDYNEDPLPEGWKFWGRDEYDVGPCIGHEQMRSYDYYIFGFKVVDGAEAPSDPC